MTVYRIHLAQYRGKRRPLQGNEPSDFIKKTGRFLIDGWRQVRFNLWQSTSCHYMTCAYAASNYSRKSLCVRRILNYPQVISRNGIFFPSKWGAWNALSVHMTAHVCSVKDPGHCVFTSQWSADLATCTIPTVSSATVTVNTVPSPLRLIQATTGRILRPGLQVAHAQKWEVSRSSRTVVAAALWKQQTVLHCN
jgi:hypothetical protein